MSFVGEAFIALAQEKTVPAAGGLTGLQLIEGLINRINADMEGDGSLQFTAYVLLGLRRNMPQMVKDLEMESGFETEAKLVLGNLLKGTKTERALFLANIKTSLELEPAGASSEADTAPASGLDGGPN
jgi:hypothetical protein